MRKLALLLLAITTLAAKLAFSQTDITQLPVHAEHGNAEAQFELGAAYIEGKGVPKDEAKGVYWFRKAAEQGNSLGQYNLGVMYEYERGGLPKNDAQAVFWYRKAAEQGFSSAQYNLALMYEQGRGGLPKDDAQAVFWYRKAADQGLDDAENNLGMMYEQGRGGLPKDDVQAVSWFRKAAEQGSDLALTNLKRHEQMKTSNRWNGTNSLLGLVLGLLVYSIVRSKRKWKTVLYAACGLFGGALATILSLGYMFPIGNREAVGRGAVPVALLTAALVGFNHSRRTRKGSAIRGAMYAPPPVK